MNQLFGNQPNLMMEYHSYNKEVSQNQFNIFLVSKCFCLKTVMFSEVSAKVQDSKSNGKYSKIKSSAI